ncbi:hypothetical protein AB0D27_28265 [Streptomyces sp. NPDC048415]|uniref:hypothetical protein n=1 Tax=Streptomyces sp. NPDC048415 TaxID=3154822 RepID=UPI0034329538
MDLLVAPFGDGQRPLRGGEFVPDPFLPAVGDGHRPQQMRLPQAGEVRAEVPPGTVRHEEIEDL